MEVDVDCCWQVGNKACCVGVVVNFALDVDYMRLTEDYGYKVEHIAC